MEFYFIISAVIIAYFMGSIPTSIWIGKGYFGVDIRDHGSGNAGATNTLRVLGKKWGSLVMAIDVLKGATATMLAYYLLYFETISNESLFAFKLGLGLVAVVGHIFPVYERFKGGKGVATFLGLILSLNFPVAILCLLTFIIVFGITKYVSVGSIAAALAYPLLQVIVPAFKPEEPWMLFVSVIMCSMVVFTHKKNIVRLFKGEESKIQLGKKS